ncbi:general secretion pathway protein M [Sulfitobacter noctilucae]|uniref:type II secretion system protein GspM n=1 Tax=Sulfitobacter noctilucae TaxID=1342302 RepID=UPI00046AC69C|nr:type II secretion system protein GspM [Sulfitobacter noctilucae]KIN74989.1 general secretion pathway protein M [Sulfitobacter noctilucae]
MKVLASLTPRERVLILGGGTLLLVFAVWFYVWQPIAAAQNVQTERIARYLSVIDLAGQMGDPVTQVAATSAPDTPLAQRITRSGEAAGIALARLDPEGRRLRVTVAEAPYADLIGWIATLEAESGVRALSVEMSRLTGPGMVSLRMTVEDAV